MLSSVYRSLVFKHTKNKRSSNLNISLLYQTKLLQIYWLLSSPKELYSWWKWLQNWSFWTEILQLRLVTFYKILALKNMVHKQYHVFQTKILWPRQIPQSSNGRLKEETEANQCGASLSWDRYCTLLPEFLHYPHYNTLGVKVHGTGGLVNDLQVVLRAILCKIMATWCWWQDDDTNKQSVKQIKIHGLNCLILVVCCLICQQIQRSEKQYTTRGLNGMERHTYPGECSDQF